MSERSLIMLINYISIGGTNMPDRTSPTRREKQVAKRIEQILDSAARLFASQGYHRTTTKEIAESADVSEGTLYNYFDSKNDLLFAILARLAEEQSEELDAGRIIKLDTRELLTTLLHTSMGSVEQHAVMQQAILSEILADESLRQRYYQRVTQPTLDALEKLLNLRVVLGQIRPIDPAATARILVSMALGLFILQVLGDPITNSSWNDMVETAVSIVFDGLES
jgi:AcrR family transcriptional regulator